jgi:hypothetical protein
LVCDAHADTIIGNWEAGSTDGWIDWGTQAVITGPKYLIGATGATLGSSALKLTASGFNQNLSIKLQDAANHPDWRPAFFANNAFKIDFSVDADANATSGFSQLFEFAINAQTYGFHGQGTNPLITLGYPNPNFRTVTLTVDYSALIDGNAGNGEIPANATYVEFIMATNSDNAAHGVFYFDNARFTTIPEPASAAMLALLPLLSSRRNRRKHQTA